jgi:tyrosyl-tRNA synthetase
VREEAAEQPAHGLAYKLLLAQSGSKFGKSEEGESIWLDAKRTTPFAFYQYWLNTDDRDVATYLRWFTEFTRAEVEGLEEEIATRPEGRGAQRALARDITARTHGEAAAAQAEADGAALFSGAPISDPATLRSLFESAGGFTFTRDALEAGVAALLADGGVVASRGEARRLIASGGVVVNGVRAADPATVPELVAEEWLDVKIGKRRREIGRLAR